MQVRQQRDIWWIQASTKTKLQLNNYWIFQIVSKPILTQRSIQMLAVYCVIKMTKLCMDFNPIYPTPAYLSCPSIQRGAYLPPLCI